MYHGIRDDVGDITLRELVESTLEYVEGKTIILKGAGKVKWVGKNYENWCDIRCIEAATAILVATTSSFTIHYLYTHKITA